MTSSASNQEESPLLGRKNSRGTAPTAKERSREEALAAWVGEERASAVFADLHPSAQHIGVLVNKCLRGLHRPDLAVFNQIRSHWPQIAGAANANLLKPIRVNGKNLVVEVANPTYMFVFRQPALQKKLLEEIQKYTNNEIKSFTFTAPGR